ncbi:outer membrane beta-barrel protein [Marinobacter sp.]|uniref:outer membrane beta-barrel protein n=1 Tax=Marinobacter sp. TaxID=50741 RepID=UPI0035670A12
MGISKKIFVATIATTGLTLSSAALAQDMYKSGVGGLYTGVNYTFMNIDAQEDADVGTLSAKVGVQATDYFGAEARAGFGVNDDTVNGTKVKLDNFFGGYATINMANESPVTPYAVLGFTRVELEAGSRSDDESDFSYGAGVNIQLAQNLSGNVEYMRYYDDSDVTIDGIGLGIQVNF